MTQAGERPLRIVIVDDEAPARNRMRDLLADCAGQLPLAIAGEAGARH
jgi:two-component system response regulator AlgR